MNKNEFAIFEHTFFHIKINFVRSDLHILLILPISINEIYIHILLTCVFALSKLTTLINDLQIPYKLTNC